MKTYKTWQKSWIKWQGDLWGRLNKKPYITIEYIRRLIFKNLLWHTCSYCKRYFDKTLDEGCYLCPLYKRKICFSILNESFEIKNLLDAWVAEDKTEFKKHHKIILQALKDTRFED